MRTCPRKWEIPAILICIYRDGPLEISQFQVGSIGMPHTMPMPSTAMRIGLWPRL